MDLEKLSIKEIFDIYLTRYVNEYNLDKANKVAYHLDNSLSFKNYINRLKVSRYCPGYIEILSFLNNDSYFVFSKGETLCLGGMMLIMEWNNKVNIDHSIASSIEVSLIAKSFIHSCSKIKFKRSENCFTKFYLDINRYLNKISVMKVYTHINKPLKPFQIIDKSEEIYNNLFNLYPDNYFIDFKLKYKEGIYTLRKKFSYSNFDEEGHNINDYIIINVNEYSIKQYVDSNILHFENLDNNSTNNEFLTFKVINCSDRVYHNEELVLGKRVSSEGIFSYQRIIEYLKLTLIDAQGLKYLLDLRIPSYFEKEDLEKFECGKLFVIDMKNFIIPFKFKTNDGFILICQKSKHYF